MGYKLVISEKPSVGVALSKVLGANKREDGFLIGGGYIVSWCVGHLIELAAPEAYDEKYAKWRFADLPIIPNPWKYAAINGTKKQLKVLATLMKRADVDSVVCATDAGREGELIFRLVYDYCKCKLPVQRLWVSSMEETAIADGFRNLKSGAEYETLYQAALCRSQADWLVGLNMTRMYSTLHKTTYNVGRVQTPTQAMIVERETNIAAFVKEPFYTVELDLGSLVASGEKLKDKTAADAICVACGGQTATVTSVERQEKTTAPPKLYDLTALQREANRTHGYTAQQTLDYIQSLYEKKLATYPRTDSRYITADMTDTVLKLIGTVDFTPNVNALIGKVSDHHAILPTLTAATADLSTLQIGARNILQMLKNRLLEAVGKKHIYAETTITLDCGGNTFTAKGKTVIQQGWKSAKSDDDGELPELSQGQTFDSVRSAVKEGFTTPPKHFTEDTLLSAMETAGDFSDVPDVERKGLGTSATRAAIIEKLVKSGYVVREKKQLLPTEKAVTLISILPDALKSPQLTAEWETELKRVENGEVTPDAFIRGITDMVESLVRIEKK